MRAIFLAFLLLLLLVLPASALAVESEGRGENIAPVKNLPYPDLHAPDEQNKGTDLEFATITVAPETAAAGAGGAASAPGAAGDGPGTSPAGAGTGAAPGASPAGTGAPPTTAAQRAAARKKAKTRLKTLVRRKCRGKRGRALVRCTRAVVKRERARAKRKAAKTSRSGRVARLTGRLTDAKPDQPGIQRNYSFAGSYGDGLHVVDITDPENATRVATWDCGISQGDVQVFQRADLGGRWFVAFTHDDGYDFHADSACATDLKGLGFDPAAVQGSGTYIADVTDPLAPKTVSFVPVEQGSHNQTVHPNGRYLYNSNADLITSPLPAVEIIDIGDITQPRKVGEVDLKPVPASLGTESHDITFNEDGSRAYVAALSHGEILDTSDPAKPVSIGTIVDPAINVWHQTDPITIDDPILGKRDFVIAEDEVAGALGTGQCPNGGVHIYDVTGDLERTPVKVGTWNIDDVGPTDTVLGTCTAHVFELHQEAKLMTIAYYNGGVRVVDLSGLVGVALGKTGIGMKQLGSYRFADSDTWSVKAPSVSRDGFYLYGNDHARGFDVYKYSKGADGAGSAGVWRSPAEARAAQEAYRGGAQKPGILALCLRELPRS